MPTLNMNSHSIRMAQPEDAKALESIIRLAFDKQVAADYQAEGIEEFWRYANAEALASRLGGNYKIYLAEVFGNPVGLLEIRSGNHVSLLFVDPAHQGKGIARDLWRRALTDMSSDKVTVKSSPFAVPAYEALGFRKTGQYTVENGIGYLPMTYVLSK